MRVRRHGKVPSMLEKTTQKRRIQSGNLSTFYTLYYHIIDGWLFTPRWWPSILRRSHIPAFRERNYDGWGGGGTKGVRKAESGYQGRVINSAPNIYIGHA